MENLFWHGRELESGGIYLPSIMPAGFGLVCLLELLLPGTAPGIWVTPS